MKRNLLRPLTRPVRSPLHSSSVCSQRIEADTSSVDYFALSDDIDLK
jgi:hypothetical protein